MRTLSPWSENDEELLQHAPVAHSEQLNDPSSLHGLHPWSRTPGGGKGTHRKTSGPSSKGARSGRLSAPLLPAADMRAQRTGSACEQVSADRPSAPLPAVRWGSTTFSGADSPYLLREEEGSLRGEQGQSCGAPTVSKGWQKGGASHKADSVLPRIHDSKEKGTKQWRPAKIFHVDEGIKPSAKARSRLLPAQSLAVRSGNSTIHQTTPVLSSHTQRALSRNGSFLQSLTVLVEADSEAPQTSARPCNGTPQAKSSTPQSPSTLPAPFVEVDDEQVARCFGETEALARMADYATHGGVWALLNQANAQTPGVNRSRRGSRTGDEAGRLRLDKRKVFAESANTTLWKASTPLHNPQGITPPADGLRLESGRNVDLVQLGTGHATMAGRAASKPYSRPATQAEREEEEALCEVMVKEFPAGWVEEASCLVGNDVWRMLNAKQQVGIVHALLADTQSALPLIRTMKKIFEAVDTFDLGDELKRDLKYRNQTGITALDNDLTVNVDSRSVQELMAELLGVAVRCNQIQQAVMLLESIPDVDQREEASELLFELSDEMLCQELRDLLKRRGFVSSSERRKHAPTPSRPSRNQALPEAAQRRLQSRHRRIAEAAAVEAEVRRRLGLDEPPMTYAQEYADDGEEEEYADSPKSRPASEGELIEKNSDAPIAVEEDDTAPEEVQEDVATDDDDAKVQDVVEEEPTVRIPSFNPEDYINRPDYGLCNDPTIKEAIEADAESSDDDNKPLDHELPQDHPVIRIFASTMGRSKLLYFSIWKAWDEARRIERTKLRDQYVSNCQCARLTPVGVQPLHRYMHASSKTNSALLLSRQCFSKTTIACLFQALIGVNVDELSFFHSKHSGCFPGWVNINELRENLGDHAMTEIDLSFNDLQCEGACILRDALLVNSSWKLTSLRLDAVDLREEGCLALIPLLTANPCEIALKQLSIAKNGIGDSGVASLVDVLGYNIQLASLNISNNSCSFKTAKALHHMLSVNYALTELDCSYNMIRGPGAVLLAQGLQDNSGLTDINLAWNGFGDSEPCDYLGAALESSSLKVVDLSYNRIGQNQALILASYLEDCPNVRKLVLDGNMLTQAGARMILQATKTAAGEEAEFFADVSMLNCGIGIVDHSAFDPTEPAGDYELDLKDKYSRNILLSLFRIVAQGRGFFVPLEHGGTEEFRSAAPGSKQSITDVVHAAKNRDLAIQDEEDEMNAMYAEAVEPIKRSKTEETGGEKAGKKGKKKKAGKKGKKKKKGQIIIPPLVFFPYRLQLPQYKLPDGSMIVNPNESDWHAPHNGTIRFKFGSLSVGANIALDPITLNKIITVFTDVEKTHALRIEAFDIHFGSQIAIHIDQAKKLLEALPEDGHDRLREKDLVLTRSAVVVRCFHRLVETDQARDLLDALDDASKALASKSLGTASFSFTRNNATGHYRLNLEDPLDRELCMRLVECYNEQRARLRQLDKDCALRRQDIACDKVERIWRNLKINNKTIGFSPSWRVPHTGRLQVDFVVVKKPAPGSNPMSGNQFREWCCDELDHLSHEQEKLVNAIRLKSNTFFFSCEQVVRLLRKLTLPVLRVELCVIAFARTIDFHNFKHLLDYMTVGEASSLQLRLGLINLWDESMAVGFYELDLTMSEHRWVCLELLFLVSEESPGGKLTDTSYEMVDFEVLPSFIPSLASASIMYV
jgi:hypothetical protein